MSKDKTEEKTEKVLQPKKSRQFLKHEFSHDEIHEKGIELARLSAEKASLEKEKTAVTSDFKAKIDGKASAIDLLGQHINSGYEHRNIDCLIHYHNPSAGKKTTVRTDTNELVRVESMNAEEMQSELEFEEEN